MSDDTNERMERAERIRRMREGQREASAETSDGSNEGPSDGVQSDDDTSDEVESGEDTSDESASATEADDSADESPPESSSTTDGTTTSIGETSAANPDDAEANAAGGDQPNDETVAAAQRAAQSAAQVTATAADAGMGDPAAADSIARDAATGGQTAGNAMPGNATAGVDTSTPAEVGESTTAGGSAAVIQGPTGVELPDQEQIAAAIGDQELESGGGRGPETARSLDIDDGTTSEETVRVLEFTLGEEHYCLDITHVEEIVKRESITRVPNTPDYVEGVVDLRGQITTILDPKALLDIDEDGPESLLVVFDPEGFEDQGAIGWVVDEVRQVVPIAESEVNDPPVEEDYIEGVVDREDEDEFVIWSNPETAMRLATAEDDENGD